MVKTIGPVMFVLALGVATVIWGMSGAGALYGTQDPVSGAQSGDALHNASDNSSVSGEGNFSGAASGETGDEGIVGIVISGIGFVVGFVKMVGLLPFELMNLGFPPYFAVPIGLLAQALVGVGIVQFATNREYL